MFGFQYKLSIPRQLAKPKRLLLRYVAYQKADTQKTAWDVQLAREMDQSKKVHIGNRTDWGENVPCGISVPDRRQHVYTIGQTGVGKSTLLKNMILQDVHNGDGVGLIDPHGQLADEVLDNIPSHRANHVVYLNLLDGSPIGLNLLHDVPPDKRHLVASGVVSIFKNFIWGGDTSKIKKSWGARLEYYLKATVSTLLECQNTSLLCIQKMLVDPIYREWVVKRIKDPAVRSFWIREFPNDVRLRETAISPIQNKVGQLTLVPHMRNTFGQIRRAIDARFMMDNKRIFLASLSKGILGEDNANLTGAVLLSLFQLAAMSRADIPENERRDFFLYVDEFHSFSTDSFASMLSESRKHRLSLTLAHQYVAQLPDNVRDAVFGNVGTLVSFRVGEADARVLSEHFGGDLKPKHFTDLSNHEARVKLLAGGEYGDPFIMETLPPFDFGYNKKESIIKTSRQRYGTPRHIVEERIERWMS